MAIEKTTNTQIACKMVDLRPLQTRTTAFIGRLEQPAAAKDVDSRLQLRKITEYVQGQRNDNKLEEQLAKYYREIEILSSLRHVCQQGFSYAGGLLTRSSLTSSESRRLL